MSDTPKCRCCYDLDAEFAVSRGGRERTIGLGNDVVCVSWSLSQFQYSAQSGCPICSVIVGALELWNAAIAAPNLVLNIPVSDGNFEVSFWIGGEEINLQLYTQDDTWNRIHPLPDITNGNLLSDGIDFVRSCLETCLKNHTKCRSTRNAPPARLLDVGDSSDTSIRLVDTEEIPNAEYTALSYCWGDSVTLKTTLANLERMRSSLPLTDLPQAHIDAVLLTRSLGIPYLWIDALCIIQDSYDDWVRESAKMSSIYGCARLVVAKSSSASAKQGFLNRQLSNMSERNQRVFSRRIDTEDGPITVKARRVLELGVHWRWKEARPDHSPREPLTLRGWTLQEQVLSTRYLSFSLGEIQWSCQELTTCECRSKLNHRRQFGRTPLSQISGPGDAFRFWKKMVENYSSRSLTNHSDTLPAISGVAEEIQRITGSPYAAGLWTNNIDLDLLWRINPGSRKPQVAEYIAPSFSWASVKGEIDYYCYRNGKAPYSTACEVVAVETQPSTNAPLGCVSHGSLTILGPLIPYTVVYEAEDGWLSLQILNSELELMPDAVLERVLLTSTDGETFSSLRRRQPKTYDPKISVPSADSISTGVPSPSSLEISDSEGTPRSETHVWLLRLGSYPDVGGRRDHELLVLGKVSDNPPLFQRLGLISSLEDAQGQGPELFKDEVVTTVNII